MEKPGTPLPWEVLAAQLQKDCGTPHLPTRLTYDLRIAVAGKGPRAYDWQDKPHRLLYDACREVEALTAINAELVAVVELMLAELEIDGVVSHDAEAKAEAALARAKEFRHDAD